MKKTGKTLALILVLMLLIPYASTGCKKAAVASKDEPKMRTIVDQVGREVELPEKIERVATSHHLASLYQRIYKTKTGSYKS